MKSLNDSNSGQVVVSGQPPAYQYKGLDCHDIEIKTNLKDLLGRALKAFKRRSRSVMKTIWKFLIQPKMYYCSQLWKPGGRSRAAESNSLLRPIPMMTITRLQFSYLRHWLTVTPESQQQMLFVGILLLKIKNLAIQVYLRLSPVISGYLILSMAISGYLRLSWAISGNLSSISDYHGLSRDILGYLSLSMAFTGYLWLSLEIYIKERASYC